VRHVLQNFKETHCLVLVAGQELAEILNDGGPSRVRMDDQVRHRSCQSVDNVPGRKRLGHREVLQNLQ